MSRFQRLIAIFFGAACIAAFLVFFLAVTGRFALQPNETAIVLRFGEITRIIKTPGVHHITPILDAVLVFSTGTQEFKSSTLAVETGDGGHVTLRGNLPWRICEPDLYFVSFGSGASSRERVNSYLDKRFRIEVEKEAKKSSTRDFNSEVATLPLQKSVNNRLATDLAEKGICVDRETEPYLVTGTSEN